MVGRVWPRHRHRGRPLNSVVRLHVTKHRELRAATFFCWLLLVPAVARADAGIPMLMLAWPAYILGLIPVILIESFIGTKDLGVSWGEVLPVAAIGNAVSTVVGIPLTWLAMLAIEFVVGYGAGALMPDSDLQMWLFPFFVAWLPPFDNIWLFYAAFVLLSVPFCVVSIWVERKVALKRLSSHPPEAVRRWVTHANIWSYSLLVACAIVVPVMGAHAT